MAGFQQYDALVSKARFMYRTMCFGGIFEKAIPVLFVLGTFAVCCFLYNEEFLRFGPDAGKFISACLLT